MQNGGWDTAAVHIGHGKTELVHRCPMHNGNQIRAEGVAE
jgi:hypothetical protein